MPVQRKTKCENLNTAPVLSLRQVSFSYEEKEVLRDVDCDFFEGRIHVIAGPSGSGKSTLMQVINGLIPHINEGRFEGSVIYRGKDITGVPVRDRSSEIGLVMQDPEGQFCTFTVEEELAFGLENHAVSPEEIGGRIRESLEFVGMQGYEERPLTDMSGGQKQKVAIASIVAMGPELLLLDEPTANLDPKSRDDVLSMIVRLARERGVTIIMVEHNLEAIMDEIDRLIIMDDKGHVAAEGERDEILEEIRKSRYDSIRHFLPRVLWNREPVRSIWEDKASNADPSGNIIEIRDLHFAYPQKNGLFRKTYGPEILKGIDLDIHRGDFLVIAGENGTGKTTLLNVLFRVYEQQRGSVRLDGEDLRKQKLKDVYSRMGLVFQNPELQFVTNQVDQELLYSFKQNREMSDREKEERVSAMLRQFHLDEYSKDSPYILSQGQKRRLSVATMLLTNQEILFLDEPTYGQDFENKRELMTDMLELNDRGVTIVFITHDDDLIKEYAQRVIYIEDGKVMLDGTAQDYFERREHAQLH